MASTRRSLRCHRENSAGILRYGQAIPDALDFHVRATGDFDMQLFALGLSAIRASLLAFAAATVLPSGVMAFETESGAVTVPGGSTQFQDRDEKPLLAPLTSLQLSKDDGTNPQTASGTGLQLTPGLSLQVTGGSGPYVPGLQPGLQMAPIIDSSNPADDRALIPRP